MSRDVRSKTERALPPWASDIPIDDADAQDNAAETAVVAHDRERSSEPPPSEDSANARSHTRVVRMEVDADILSLFKSSLAEAIDRWRDLYSRRVRRGTNKDLSSFTCAAAALVPARPDRLMIYRGLIRDDHGFFTFVEDVLSQADFFDEYPDFVTNMLDIVYNICDKAGDDPVLRSRALRLVETACRNAWERRWLLEDDKEIDKRYPMARQDIRNCLRSVILHHALSSNCNPTLILRRASFLCWYCGTEAPAGSRPGLSLPISLLHFSLLGSPIEGEDTVLPDEDTFEFIRLAVLPTFGAEKYLARLLQTLRRDDLFDTHLNRTIKVLYRSIIHPDLFAQLGPSGVLGAALDAVNRQGAHGKPGSQNASISSLMALYTLTTELATDVPDARMAIPSLFLDGCYVNVVARAIRAWAIGGHSHWRILVHEPSS